MAINGCQAAEKGMPKAEHDNRKFNPCSSCDLVLKFTQMTPKPSSNLEVKRLIETEIIEETVTDIQAAGEQGLVKEPRTIARPPGRKPPKKRKPPMKRKPPKKGKPPKKVPVKRKPAKGTKKATKKK